MHGRVQSGRLCSQLTVGFVLFLFFGGEWWVYHVTCSPTPLRALFFNVFFVLAAWSYLSAALTDPGSRGSPEWEPWLAQQRAQLGGEDMREPEEDRPKRSWAAGEATWCKRCLAGRPERAHHCAVCDVCVLRMDHHCPWIGNCIGWRNHKFFILLNFWSFVACATLLLTMRGPTAAEAFIAMLQPANDDPSFLPIVASGTAVVLCTVTGGMVLNSVFMATRNVTTVEELFPGENPYMLESSWANMSQIMGPFDWQLFFPIEPKQRLSGTAFPVFHSGKAGESSTAQRYGAA